MPRLPRILPGYNTLMLRIRQALDEGTFEEFRARYSGLLEKPRIENPSEFTENPCQVRE